MAAPNRFIDIARTINDKRLPKRRSALIDSSLKALGVGVRLFAEQLTRIYINNIYICLLFKFIDAWAATADAAWANPSREKMPRTRVSFRLAFFLEPNTRVHSLKMPDSGCIGLLFAKVKSRSSKVVLVLYLITL